MREIVNDLAAQHEQLDRLLASIPPEDWDRPTPAVPWTVRDQVAHLAFFDEMAVVSVADPGHFMARVSADLADGLEEYVEAPLRHARSWEASAVLDWWRRARGELLQVFSAADPELRVPWYGPPMKAHSSAVARLMETWAHGQDVFDAVGRSQEPTDRLFHVAELGVKTFRFSYENRGLTAPEGRVHVALSGPSGDTRVWNEGHPDSITGPVEDFCLVVTQRRHVSDTALVVSGPVAEEWMAIAQVFAGPPGPGRDPVASD